MFLQLLFLKSKIVTIISFFQVDLIQLITVDSLLTDTSVKRTPRIGPCLSLHPLFDPLQDGHLSKTDTLPTAKCADVSLPAPSPPPPPPPRYFAPFCRMPSRLFRAYPTWLKGNDC